jgi:hypothetical protein
MQRPIYRGASLVLWGLAAWSSFACRGLFWDGAAFLVNIVDQGTFHDFYPARAHVGWVTQLPVLLALHLGVVDLKLLAMIQSAALFAVPVALYQLALARARGDGLLTAIVLAIVAIVYLPTSFFIVGEYNAAYAAVTAAMAIALTSNGGRGDGILLLALGALCLRSYEAMVYLGPLLAAAVLWTTWRARDRAPDDIARLFGTVAALAFVGGALVSGITMAIYWNHPHFVLVRAAVPDFWQNLQFVVPLAVLSLFAGVCIARPRALLGRTPLALIGLAALLLAILPWVRLVRPETYLFPPSHYVARTAAGCLLWALLVAMWIHVAFPRSRLAVLACLRRPEVGRKLAAATFILVLAAAVPDLMLTHLWRGYVGFLRSVIVSRGGLVRASELPMNSWPNRLFDQHWTLPALSAILRGGPDEAIVVAVPDFREALPFDPACGTLPRLHGYGWRAPP